MPNIPKIFLQKIEGKHKSHDNGLKVKLIDISRKSGIRVPNQSWTTKTKKTFSHRTCLSENDPNKLDLSKEGYVYDTAYSRKALMLIDTQKCIEEGFDCIRIINNEKDLAVVDILQLDLGSKDKSLLFTTAPIVTNGTGGVCIGKTTGVPYVSYGIATRPQGLKSGLIINGSNKSARFYTRGEGLGTEGGLSALYPTSSILQPGCKRNISNPTGLPGRNEFENLSKKLPPCIPHIKSRLRPFGTSIALRFKENFAGMIPYHYDSTDHDSHGEITYYSLYKTKHKKNNLAIAIFDTGGEGERRIPHNEQMRQKGFVVFTETIGHTIRITFNSVRCGHSQFIQNPQLLQFDVRKCCRNFKRNDCVVARWPLSKESGWFEGRICESQQIKKAKSGTQNYTVKYSDDNLKAVVEGIWDEIRPPVKQVAIIVYTSEAIVKKHQLHETSPLIHPSVLAITTQSLCAAIINRVASIARHHSFQGLNCTQCHQTQEFPTSENCNAYVLSFASSIACISEPIYKCKACNVHSTIAPNDAKAAAKVASNSFSDTDIVPRKT